MKTIISCDPGASGGLACFIYGQVRAIKMPETTADVCDFFREVLSETPRNETRCFLEKVGGFMGGGGQPGSAMFNFGQGYGEIIGILTALQIPFELVTPQRWQKALALGTKEKTTKLYTVTPEEAAEEKKRVTQANARHKTEWKNKLKEKAQQLYPSLKVTLATADALLILEYGRRQENMMVVADRLASQLASDLLPKPGIPITVGYDTPEGSKQTKLVI